MKIPKEAKRVFKGVIFDVYHWEQKMLDGSKAPFEMLKRPNSAHVIAVADGKILLADEEQPYEGRFYTLFGGRQDGDETALQGAQRELLEESGYASDDWELLRMEEPYTKIEWEASIFIARDCKKVQEHTRDAGENITIKAVTFEEFFDIATKTEFREVGLSLDLMRMRYQEPKRLEAFKKKLFG